MAYQLTPDQLKSNYDKLLSLIDETFPSRPNLRKVYEAYEERLVFQPASGFDYFHNAFPGGYCDHVLRVIQYSKYVYKLYEKLGLDVTTFTLEELLFAALNHDLGKMGFPVDNGEGYIANDSDWHKKNQGRLYKSNESTPYATVPDLSLYILQKYGVAMSWNEYHAIKIHDGMYDDGNKSYLTSFSASNKLRSSIAIVLHQADMMASRFEWERWNKTVTHSESNQKISTESLVEWDVNKNPEVNLMNSGFATAAPKTKESEFDDIFNN